MNEGWIFALGTTLGFLAGVTLKDALDLYRQSRRDNGPVPSRGRSGRHAHH